MSRSATKYFARTFLINLFVLIKNNEKVKYESTSPKLMKIMRNPETPTSNVSDI